MVNYPGVVHGVANIEFCIATLNHPSNTDPGLEEGGPAVTIGYNFGNGGDVDINWAGYMNFLVKDTGDDILGYSPFGGSIASGESVVINTFAFGSGTGCTGYIPQEPFHLGRTVTHELGHFYNLDHTFTGSCNTDDGIADTPNIIYPNYGCSNPGSIAACDAEESALTMSYMDYGDDNCLYMFSEGQTTIVDSYVSAVLQSQFKPNTISCEPSAPEFIISATENRLETCVEQVSFKINFYTINGFNETVTLAASEVPSGVNASLSESSISTNGSVTLDITNISVLDPNDYTVKLNATSALITKVISLTLAKVTEVCSSAGDTVYATATTGVIFNTISNLDKTPKTAPYSDFRAIETDIIRGDSYDLTVNVNTDGEYDLVTKVWFDWNQNCNFEDTGEGYELGSATNTSNGPTANSPFVVQVPEDAVLGSTTMRVTTKYTATGSAQYAKACQTNFDGEVEDYTVNVVTALSVSENEFEAFSLFPNPNNGSFRLKLQSNSKDNINIEICDLRGRKVFKRNYENTLNFDQTIELKKVASGLYLITVSDGQIKTTKRLVIE